MSNTLCLNCTVVGATNHIFQVKIASTNTASALLKAIKDEKSSEVCDIDDGDLALYDVSLPINVQVEPDILKDILGSKHPLQPTIQLSAIFAAPLYYQQLHIIVGAVSAFAKVDTILMGSLLPLIVVLSKLQVTLPELITLNFLVCLRDNPRRWSFPITIDRNKRVFDLGCHQKKEKSRIRPPPCDRAGPLSPFAAQR